MKPSASLLLILIPLLQLVVPGSTQCSLDAIVEKKIKDVLDGLECNPSAAAKKLVCTSITNSGKLSSCPEGMSVTGCACGYACGSWDIRNEKTCHCQCSVVDWTTARCCHLA
ncbi:resistin-like beta [Eulemur rufifrons]|uniref:resistin-like beta n=1 Tax=Eulemur rufifrons TaxID=859984 RepID=UPI0037442287